MLNQPGTKMWYIHYFLQRDFANNKYSEHTPEVKNYNFLIFRGQ